MTEFPWWLPVVGIAPISQQRSSPYIQCEGDAPLSAVGSKVNQIYGLTQLLKCKYLVSLEMLLPTMASPELCGCPIV